VLFLTDFADPGLVLPLAALVALSLAAVGRRRQAFAWSLAVAGTLGAMLVLKASSFALAAGGFGNPSGHTAAGVVVYAGLLTLVGERFAPRLPVALLSGAALAALFGLTRLEVGGHTLPEVLVGAAVGMAGALALAGLAGPRRSETPKSGHAVVAAAALLAVLAFHGNRLHADAELRRVVSEFRSAGEL
jgi:membrane-associated phospholipid phosphatase